MQKKSLHEKFALSFDNPVTHDNGRCGETDFSEMKEWISKFWGDGCVFDFVTLLECTAMDKVGHAQFLGNNATS